MATHPVGDFTWVGRIPDGCTGTVTWDVDFVPESGYSNTPPYYEATSDGRVVVTAGVETDGVTPMPVSPGILTFIPTVTNSGESVTLNPIVLEIRLDEIAVPDLLVGHAIMAGKTCSTISVEELTSSVARSYSVGSVAISRARWSPDGLFFAVVGANSDYGYVVEAATGSIKVTVTFSSGARDVDWSSSGDVVVFCGSGLSKNNLAIVRKLETGWGVSYKVMARTIYRVKFSPDGTWLACGSSLGYMYIYRVLKNEANELEITSKYEWVDAKGGEVESVDWSKDGLRVLRAYQAGSGGTKLRIHTREGGFLISASEALSGQICWTARYSPDGTLIATGWGSSGLIVFNASDLSIAFSDSSAGIFKDVAWSADGAYLAIARSILVTSSHFIYNTSTWTRRATSPSSLDSTGFYAVDFKP